MPKIPKIPKKPPKPPKIPKPTKPPKKKVTKKTSGSKKKRVSPKKKTKRIGPTLTKAEREILNSLPPGARRSMEAAVAKRAAASKVDDVALKKSATKEAEEKMNRLSGQMLYGALKSPTFRRGGRIYKRGGRIR